MLPQWFLNLPWDALDVVISLVELLVISVPAATIFIYYKLQSVALRISEVTENGASLLIHNKTNRSIFISDVQFVAIEESHFVNPVLCWDKSLVQLKPDEFLEIVVNYTKTSHTEQLFRFVVHYDHKRRKKVKGKI